MTQQIERWEKTRANQPQRQKETDKHRPANLGKKRFEYYKDGSFPRLALPCWGVNGVCEW